MMLDLTMEFIKAGCQCHLYWCRWFMFYFYWHGKASFASYSFQCIFLQLV